MNMDVITLREDPVYIQNLLDPRKKYSCYFSIGDPHSGPIERIGVVPTMLMAHSLVLRRVLDIQKSELKEKWDIPVLDITPMAFKDLLKYTYGYNNVKDHSLPHSLELLSIADRWVMESFSEELANHIAAILKPVNIFLAMANPVCLKVKKVEEVIARALKDHTSVVLTNPNLHLVCPAGMRYILQQKSLSASPLDLWWCVLMWARKRVINSNPMHPNMDMYTQPRLMVPSSKFVHLCALNIVNLVEKILAKHPDAEELYKGLTKYHFIPSTTSQSLYVCTESKHKNHLKHEEFEAKIVHNCGSWMDAYYVSETMLMITNNTKNYIELHSLVCKSKQRLIDNIMDFSNLDLLPVASTLDTNFSYDCKCTIKFIHISDSGDECVGQVFFEDKVFYGSDFQIVLSDEKLKLQPKSSYRITTKFSIPHPLWYEYDVKSESSELEVRCGLVNEEYKLNGSHIKCLLFKSLVQDMKDVEK